MLSTKPTTNKGKTITALQLLHLGWNFENRPVNLRERDSLYQN